MNYKDFSKNNLELITFDYTMNQLREEKEFLSEAEFASVFDYEYKENMKEARKIYLDKMKEILSKELVMPKMDFYKINDYKIPSPIKLGTDHLTNIEEVWRVQQLNYLKEWNK